MFTYASWHSYPKVYALGHRAIAGILDGPVLVEEKIDGSQFSFGRFDGVLRCKSHHANIVIEDPGMFAAGVSAVAALDLVDGWTYRGEYLRTPRHNTLCYSRIPEHHVILFDVSVDFEMYMTHEAKEREAARLGLDVVPEIRCDITSLDALKKALETESCLGGTPIEGIVIKNYGRLDMDGHTMMGKYVSERFKEQNKIAWRAANPARGDVVQMLIDRLRTEARWQKAVQHLAEQGVITDDPRDIGPLIVEVKRDLVEECADDIREACYCWAKDKIARGVVAGLAEWYKDKLANREIVR